MTDLSATLADDAKDASDGLNMCVTPGSACERDPQAQKYFDENTLPLDAIVMALFDSSDDCIKLVSPDGSLQLMNCNGRQAMEIEDFGKVAGAQWDALWPEEARATVRQSITEALSGKRARFEAYCPTAKGNPRWWEVTVAPIVGGGGEVTALLSSSRDITERVRREQSLHSIADEMRHRLRNAFAVSAAIVTVSARDTPEHGAFAEALSRRLTNLADAQVTLLDLEGKAPLRALVERVIDLRDTTMAGFTVGEMPDVMLGEASAKAIALAIGELATNSLKYGALGTGGTASLCGAQKNDTLELVWTETRGNVAPALASFAGSSGLGTTIIERMLNAVGGTMTSRPTESGYQSKMLIRLWQK